MRLVTMTVHRRPHYLRETLASWSRVRGLDRWCFEFAVEPSPELGEVLRVIEEFGMGEAHVNGVREGVSRNPHVALSRAFRRADFAVLAEEDIVVSDDILEYFEWAEATYAAEPVLAVCARSPLREAERDAVRRIDKFEVQVWGTWSDRWERLLAPTWDFDYSTYTGEPGNHAGWDWNITERVMPSMFMQCVRPDASRVSHIGVEGGEHTTPETAEADASPTFEAHREPVAYRQE